MPEGNYLVLPVVLSLLTLFTVNQPSDPPPSDASDLSAETLRGLGSAWAVFARFCADTGRRALPADPATVVGFLVYERDRVALSSLYRSLQAIDRAHAEAGEPSPVDSHPVRTKMAETREALDLIQMSDGPPVLAVSPDFPDDLVRMAEATPGDLVGLRDRAVLLLGRAARLNRSQLVQLAVADVDLAASPLRVRTQDRGTPLTYDVVQQGVPDTLDVRRAVAAWLAASEVTSGRLFRGIDRWGNLRDRPLTPQAVTVILHNAAERAGVPPGQANTRLFTRP